MQNNNPKNSVIIISYNQEKIISRAIESILVQKEDVYELIICDDCSTDNTWNIIQNYYEKYPGLIKSFRNDHNLGIFLNIENTWSKPSGDILWYLAGDDEYCYGIFAEANKLINKYKIDFINDAITLYFDYEFVTPTGYKGIYRNNLVEKYNVISLKIRQLIQNRAIGVSRKVYQQYYSVRKDIGIMTDGLLDIQAQLFSEKNYYSKFVGSIYYTDIGISSIVNEIKILESYVKSLEQLKLDIKNLCIRDYNWLLYLQKQVLFRINPNINNYIIYVHFYFKTFDVGFGLFYINREMKCIIKDTIKLIKNILP